MASLFNYIQKALAQGQNGALATIVRRKGSVPRKEGAHFFLTSTGDLYGTIGGGGLEAEVIKEAGKTVGDLKGSLLTFSLVEGDDPSDMVCGGNVTVLVEPVQVEDKAVHDLIVETLSLHDACCFFRLFHHDKKRGGRLESGPKGVIKADGTHLITTPIEGDFEKRVLAWGEVLLKEEATTIRIIDPEVLDFPTSVPWNLIVFEALRSFPRLVIFGGGHLSKALCAMASLCHFQVEVIDDREEFANKTRFPEAVRAFHIPGYQKVSDLIVLDANTYVVIATRGHRFDEIVLAQVIDKNLPYIGMVGSRQKNAIVFERLRERGVPQTLLEKVRAPIGLSIHSETPEEIAVSILAEIIQTRGSQRKK